MAQIFLFAFSSISARQLPPRTAPAQEHNKIVTRHVWADYMDEAHHIRYRFGMKELYGKRKETIERDFGDAKEKHGMRYTQYRGKPKIEMVVAMTYTAMNLKKLARWLAKPILEPLSLVFAICKKGFSYGFRRLIPFS